MAANEDILFHEVQKLRQWWIWLLVALCVAGGWLLFLLQMVEGTPLGNNPEPDTIVWLTWAVFGIILPIFFLSVKFETTVNRREIHINYFPMIRRRVLPRQIKEAYVRAYRPLREYGGWGVRWSRGKGWAFNVSGSMGVQLEIVDGRKLLIGSGKPEELLAAIQEMLGTRAPVADEEIRAGGSGPERS